MITEPLAVRDNNRRSTDSTPGTSSLPLSGEHEVVDLKSSHNRPQDLQTHASINFYNGLDLNDQFEANFVDSFVQDLGFNGAVPCKEAVDIARQASTNLQDSAKSSPIPESVLWSIPNWDQPPAFDASTTVSVDSLPSFTEDTALMRLFADASSNAPEPVRFSPTGCLGDIPGDLSSFVNALTSETAFPELSGHVQYPDPQDHLVNEPYSVAQLPPALGTFTKTPTRSSFAGHRTAHPNLQLHPQTQKHVTIDELTPSSPETDGSKARPTSNNKASKRFKFSPAKPKKSPGHPWIRSSGTRKPLGAARTGKINKYNPEDHYVLSGRIVENMWRASNGTRFEYNKFGELDRQSVKLSIDDMQAFLYENPAEPVLWIQTCPADSARRYNTVGSSKCRFKDCPASVYKNTIAVGILRVAIDEAWPSLGAQRDPFHCAGFVHLYCAERFLDWPAVCADLDVRVDDRVFASEPNGRFAASLFNTSVADVAARFIKYARYDAVHGSSKLIEKFPRYPPHIQPIGPPKDHPHTLTHAMMSVKISTMTARRVEALAARGERGSHMQQHLGDLQQAVKERRAVAIQKKRKRETEQLRQIGAPSDGDIDDDDDDGLTAGKADDVDVESSVPEGAPTGPQRKRPDLVAAPPAATSADAATTLPTVNTRSASREATAAADAAAAAAAGRIARRAALKAELARLDATSAEDAMAAGLASTFAKQNHDSDFEM